MGKITNFEAAQSLFAGQGDLIIFDPITDYASATLATLANPKSLGQIVQDSTSWDGDDVSVDQIKDEQGDIITARVTAGTLAFSFELASTSQEMITKFLKGTNVTPAAIAGFTGTPSKITGFGVELPVFTAPMAIVNDELNRAWLYPKAKVTSNLAYSDGLWRIKASVLAEFVDTASLKTGMVIDGTLDYTGE